MLVAISSPSFTKHYELLTSILAQNKNKPHFEVNRQYWPSHGAPCYAKIGEKPSI